jgi:hypothetical protein
MLCCGGEKATCKGDFFEGGGLVALKLDFLLFELVGIIC